MPPDGPDAEPDAREGLHGLGQGRSKEQLRDGSGRNMKSESTSSALPALCRRLADHPCGAFATLANTARGARRVRRGRARSTEHVVGRRRGPGHHPAPHRGHRRRSARRSSSRLYNDSDHVTVVTPSIALGIENVSGASLHATYLVDVVSAASVDIVSTASSRWKEVRQAGSVVGRVQAARLRRHASGTSVSSEPDYLSYGAYATRDQGLRREELDALLRLRVQPRHHRALRRLRRLHAVQRLLARASSAGRSTAASTSSSTASRSRRSRADVIIENGDQSKPYRYIPMFSSDVAPTVPKGASIDLVNANAAPRATARAAPALARSASR